MEKQKSRRKWVILTAITLIALVLLTIFVIQLGHGNGWFKLVLSPSSVTLPQGKECNLTLNVISTGYDGNVTFSLSLGRPEYGFIINHGHGLEDLFLKAYENKTITIPVSALSDAKLRSYSVFVIAHASNSGNWLFRVDSNAVKANVTEEGGTG